MAKTKNKHDIISEQEFTIEGRDTSTDPQEDSPGDSEEDADAEFSMGMYYQPSASDLADDKDIPPTEGATLERPNNLVLTPQTTKLRVPSSAMVKSSEQPSPREDKDRKSSSN